MRANNYSTFEKKITPAAVWRSDRSEVTSGGGASSKKATASPEAR